MTDLGFTPPWQAELAEYGEGFTDAHPAAEQPPAPPGFPAPARETGRAPDRVEQQGYGEARVRRQPPPAGGPVGGPVGGAMVVPTHPAPAAGRQVPPARSGPVPPPGPLPPPRPAAPPGPVPPPGPAIAPPRNSLETGPTVVGGRRLEGDGPPGLPVRPPLRAIGAPAAEPPAATLEIATPAVLRQLLRDTPDPGPLAVPMHSRAGQLTVVGADQYAMLTRTYRQMYWVAPAAIAYPSVIAHVRLGTQLLNAPGPARARRILGASLAETAMLAGRMAFFDLARPHDAQDHYLVAYRAAKEAGDSLLAAAVLAHTAFIPAFDAAPSAAEDILTFARKTATRGAPMVMLAWFDAVQSEFESLRGTPERGLHLLDRAEDLLCHPDNTPTPPWLDFFDASRLWGFRGKAELTARRMDQAQGSLNDALQNLPPNGDKQRAVMYADLAEAAFQAGQVDEACGRLFQAVDMLRVHWYSMAMDRVRGTRRQLEPYKSSVAVRQLDEVLESFSELAPTDETGFVALPGADEPS
ncbi:hypothetical protein [Embleya sp. NPDC005575]|uniref:hypothetical protein n=1 Tax=Embleya sp. NPDC005575 TaxID=3156892 RepID=UPI0033B08531